MPKRALRVLLLLSSLLTGDLFAAAIGMPQERARVGYGIGVARVTVDGPEVATGGEWALRPLNLIYTGHWRHEARYWGELFYHETAFDAAAGQAGQQLKQAGVRLSLQKSVALTSGVAPWFGAGLQLSRNRFLDRHTVDSDGYLDITYPDRSEFNVALLLNMSLERPLNRDWDVVLKMEQSLPSGGGVRESSLSAALLYRY